VILHGDRCFMTPFPDPNPRPQLQCISRTRAHNEMSFSQLKGRFLGLKSLRVAPDRACDITCAILHNIANIRKRKKNCLIKPKINDKTNLLSSLSFISIVLCKEKPVIQSSFNKRCHARSAIVLCVK